MPPNTKQSYEERQSLGLSGAFRGLVYRYDNRALLFLHSRPLVDFLVSLYGDPRTVDDFTAERGLGEETAVGLSRMRSIN